MLQSLLVRYFEKTKYNNYLFPIMKWIYPYLNFNYIYILNFNYIYHYCEFYISYQWKYMLQRWKEQCWKPETVNLGVCWWNVIDIRKISKKHSKKRKIQIFLKCPFLITIELYFKSTQRWMSLRNLKKRF